MGSAQLPARGAARLCHADRAHDGPPRPARRPPRPGLPPLPRRLARVLGQVIDCRLLDDTARSVCQRAARHRPPDTATTTTTTPAPASTPGAGDTDTPNTSASPARLRSSSFNSNSFTTAAATATERGSSRRHPSRAQHALTPSYTATPILCVQWHNIQQPSSSSSGNRPKSSTAAAAAAPTSFSFGIGSSRRRSQLMVWSKPTSATSCRSRAVVSQQRIQGTAWCTACARTASVPAVASRPAAHEPQPAARPAPAPTAPDTPILSTATLFYFATAAITIPAWICFSTTVPVLSTAAFSGLPPTALAPPAMAPAAAAAAPVPAVPATAATATAAVWAVPATAAPAQA